MTDIAHQVSQIKERINTYEQQYGRKHGAVQLLAVSKFQAVEKIKDAIDAGLYAFGENYLQEALIKIETLKNNSLEWHFIGTLQSNKTRKIAEHFAWVHSVTHLKLAERLSEQRPPHLPPLNICIEVNVNKEKSKSGVYADEVLPLAKGCLHLKQIRLRGLMCIPAAQDDFQKQRAEFHQLFLLKQSLAQQGIPLDTLSMGMSDDFEAAIAEGATIVRIGTALFGQRRTS